jgi:hypothetical protein
VAHVVHPADGAFNLQGFDTLVDAILGIIARHPMREDDLVRTLERWAPGQVNATLNELKHGGKAQVIERYGCPFWSAVSAHYPDSENKR